MDFVARDATALVADVARDFGAVVLTGPRRAGKTELLRRVFPDATYVLLEDPDVQARVRRDTRGFLDALNPPVVLDEIQNVPELFPYVRARIDADPSAKGRWLITGSQESSLMRGVTESMAGRAAILSLLPFSLHESSAVDPFIGGYPEVHANQRRREIWFSSYIQTYLERDVRAVANIRDLSVFRRFLGLLAARHGQVVNKAAIAAPLGVSIPTVGAWIEILEVTGQIAVVPPYFENMGKRLIKAPKIYIGDSGMACHLLGIASREELERSPFLGPIFEGFVASEILKSQAHQGRRKELYYFRDQQGLEVDFLFPGPSGAVWMIECKASRTPEPNMAKGILSLMRAAGGERGLGRRGVMGTVVHRRAKTPAPLEILAPGVNALDIETFSARLYPDPSTDIKRAAKSRRTRRDAHRA